MTITTEKIYPYVFEFRRLRTSYDELKNDDGSGKYRDLHSLFFLRCYHFADSLVASGLDKNLVYTFIRKSKHLSLCRDLANTLKHKKPRGSIFNFGGFDPVSRHVDWFDGGVVKTCVHPVNQTFPMDAQELAHQCLHEWEDFLYTNDIKI